MAIAFAVRAFVFWKLFFVYACVVHVKGTRDSGKASVSTVWNGIN